MDDFIQVCAVYPSGRVRIYGPQQEGLRRRVKTLQFRSYGKAVLFAQQFEEEQREWYKRRRK